MKAPKIIFEDESILVFDKPSGLVVNSSQTVKEQTLQDYTLHYLKITDLGIGDRAGIVHRLDRETSGLLAVAKNNDSFKFLQLQFKTRRVRKKYLGLVHGFVKNKAGEINEPLTRGKFGKFTIGRRGEGREAKSRFELSAKYVYSDIKMQSLLSEFTKPRRKYFLANAKNYSLVDLYPKTGRTHQLRVHLKSLGHPIVSDLIYLPAKLMKFDLLWCERLFLHASEIEFVHPATKKLICFRSPLPKELENAILNLERI